MTAGPMQALPPARDRRIVMHGLLRSVGVATFLMALYCVAPLHELAKSPIWVSLSGGLLVLAAVTVYEVRATLDADYPRLRAIEALATTIPLFLVMFAANYFVMAQNSSANFNVHTLSRTSAFYFTVSTFSTVGYGDITAASQTARVLVMVQIALGLIILGLGIRVFISAVQTAAQERAAEGTRERQL